MKIKLILLVLFLLLSQVNFSQNTYRITTSNGKYIFTKKIQIKKNGDIDIVKENGDNLRIKKSKFISIRELKPNWSYFDWKIDGFTDYVVVKTDSIVKDKLYNLIKNWVKETYENPESVIKAEINNSKIRISGSKQNGVRRRILGTEFPYDIRYSIEISVRDGRYKFDPIQFEWYIPPSQYSSGGWENLPINNQDLRSKKYLYYNKKGALRKEYRYFPSDVEIIFNSLNQSLYNYIQKNKKGSTIKSDKDDW